MELERDHQDDYYEFWYCVSTLLVGIGGLLRDALVRYRYVGPLRDLHPAAGSEQGGPVLDVGPTDLRPGTC